MCESVLNITRVIIDSFAQTHLVFSRGCKNYQQKNGQNSVCCSSSNSRRKRVCLELRELRVVQRKRENEWKGKKCTFLDAH